MTRICLHLEPQDVRSLSLTSKSLAETLRSDQECNRGPMYSLQKCNHDSINYYLEQELYTLDELLLLCMEVDSPESLQHLLDRNDLPVTYKVMDRELIYHCLSERCFNYIISVIDLTKDVYSNLGEHVVTLGNYRCMTSLLKATKRYDNDITSDDLQYPFMSSEEVLKDYYQLLEVLVEKMTDSQYNHVIYSFFYSYGRNHGLNGSMDWKSDNKITDSQAVDFINRIMTSHVKKTNINTISFMILRFIEDRYFESYRNFVMKFDIRNIFEYNDTMSTKLQCHLYTTEELEKLYEYHLEAYNESLSHIYTNKIFVNSIEFPSHLIEKPHLYDTPEFFCTMTHLCTNQQNILEYKDKHSYSYNHLYNANQVSRHCLVTNFRTDLTPEELGFLKSYYSVDGQLGIIIDLSVNRSVNKYREVFGPIETSILNLLITGDDTRKVFIYHAANSYFEIVEEPEIELKSVKSCGCVLNDEECKCDDTFTLKLK